MNVNGSIRLARAFCARRRLRKPPADAGAFALPDRLEPADGLSVSVHDDGLVALDPKSGLVFTANRVGACIWMQMERRTPPEAIAAELSRAYRIDRATALEDTCRFLSDLHRRGLLRTAAAS